MKYILYIDFSSVPYSSEHVESQLKKWTVSFRRLNENIWLFNSYEHAFASEFLSVEEAIFLQIHQYEEEIDNSIIFISELNQRHNYFNLPGDLNW
ncbi:hypothetical protein [Enterococcus innesii]|uniref:hypothetical protein n=1 Tax=Enterococcus innesii TaxID=2839759 RepID=UPI002090D08A|nr:hypothetical protein [Enterococcus innesii]MCO5495878.1 hypothetical protein [Enterococcus innesii]